MDNYAEPDDIPEEQEKSDWAKIPRTPDSQGGVVPAGWKPTAGKPVPVVRCTQIKKDGERCGRWSLRGTVKCLVHGGRLPSVKEHAAATVEAARLRLIDLSDPAIDVLDDLIKPGTADAIRLKAATEILDRAGVRGAVEITMDVTHTVDPAVEVARRLKEIEARIRGTEESDEIVVEEEPESEEGFVDPDDA